jgi:hypothetical protein
MRAAELGFDLAARPSSNSLAGRSTKHKKITRDQARRMNLPLDVPKKSHWLSQTPLKARTDRRPTNCARSFFSLRRNIFCL